MEDNKHNETIIKNNISESVQSDKLTLEMVIREVHICYMLCV